METCVHSHTTSGPLCLEDLRCYPIGDKLRPNHPLTKNRISLWTSGFPEAMVTYERRPWLQKTEWGRIRLGLGQMSDTYHISTVQCALWKSSGTAIFQTHFIQITCVTLQNILFDRRNEDRKDQEQEQEKMHVRGLLDHFKHVKAT